MATLPTREVTLPVQPTNPRPRTLVTADGEHLVSHAGSLLLVETADTVGLTNQLGRRANLGRRAGGHDRGVVLRDLLVMLADGGDGFGDLAALRDQPELFGQVASTSTAWRVVAEEVAGDPRGVAALWSALARARETAWALGAAPPGPLVIDIDATLVTAHSDKQGAAPTFKQGFGFHPLVCYLDRGDGTGEALSGNLRPGNAGSNTAADHLDVLAMALLALPKAARTGPILVRADSAGAAHPFVEELHRRGLAFSIGFPMEPAVKQAVLAAPADGWLPARDQDDHDRPGAWVCELANLPCHGFAANDAWLTLVLCAQTLVCWTQALCLEGELEIAEPKTLRYRLWHTAGRLVRHGRRLILCLQRTWPWTQELVAAFGRLQALPARC